MSIKVYFDLDGTVFDLYNQDNWLNNLRNEVPGVFNGDFLPEIDTDIFYELVNQLLFNGVQFGVITWLPMQASPEYEKVCAIEKQNWVEQNLPFITEFNCVSYGIPKQDCIQKRAKKMYLIDDNEEVCQTWETAEQRKAININKDFTIVDALKKLIEIIEIEK